MRLFTARVEKLEQRVTPRGPTRITVKRYYGEDTQPLRKQYGLPERIDDWPAEYRAMITPFSVRTVII